MAEIEFYRYLSDAEKDFIIEKRRIKSTAASGLTWYTTERYEDNNEAQRMLALLHSPRYRIGPIPADQMPDLQVRQRPVGPKFGQPGGGVEAATLGEVRLFSIYGFDSRTHIFPG